MCSSCGKLTRNNTDDNFKCQPKYKSDTNWDLCHTLILHILGIHYDCDILVFKMGYITN